MNITVSITRYNPATDEAPHVQAFEASAAPTDRVLAVLMDIKRHQDGTLGFRKSCAHGVCGSCAMMINGTERLACKTLVQDVATADGDVVTVAPLRSSPVQRDLMIDQDRFFENYRKSKPFLMAKEESPDREYVQSAEERAAFDDPTKCILCGACYSSCPVVAEKNPDFVGPAAIVQAARFINDSRDKGLEGRLEVLDDSNGVWACDGHFNCTKVCPRSIKVTKNINLLKRDIKKRKEASD